MYQYINIYTHIWWYKYVWTFGCLPPFFPEKMGGHPQKTGRQGGGQRRLTAYELAERAGHTKAALDVGSPEDTEAARVFFLLVFWWSSLVIFDLNAGILISRICMKHYENTPVPNIINFYEFFCFWAGLLHRDCLPDCDDADVRNPMKFDCPLQWACEGNSGCCSNEEIPAALVHFKVPRLLWSCSLWVYMSLKLQGFCAILGPCIDPWITFCGWGYLKSSLKLCLGSLVLRHPHICIAISVHMIMTNCVHTYLIIFMWRNPPFVFMNETHHLVLMKEVALVAAGEVWADVSLEPIGRGCRQSVVNVKCWRIDCSILSLQEPW